MRFLQNTKHYSLLKKSMAVLLIFALFIQYGLFMISAEVDDSWETNIMSPTVRYDGDPLSDGDEIPEDAQLTVCYEFISDFYDLAGSIKTISLPDHLLAVCEGSFNIAGIDSEGIKYNVGELTIDSGQNIIVKFSDELYNENENVLAAYEEETIAPAYKEDEAQTTDEENTHNTNDEKDVPGINKENTLSQAGEKELGADNNDAVTAINNQLTVKFEIPCVLDLQNIPRTGEGKPRQISLMSGGHMITVSLITSSAQLASNVTSAMSVMPPLEEAVTISVCNLYKQGSGDIVYDDDIIYSTELMRLYYEFSINYEQVDAIRSVINNGDDVKYAITIPDGLKCVETGTTNIIAELERGGMLKFAELTIDPSNEGAYLWFTGDFWASEQTEINFAFIYIACALDMNEIGSNEKYTIHITSSSSVTITVGDNLPVDHKLIKEGKYENKLFSWTVTFIPGNGAIALPLTFIDTFDGSEQSFVNGSLTVNGVAADNYDVSSDNGITTVTYIIYGPLTPEEPIIFNYQTALTVDAFDDGNYSNDTEVNNSVRLYSDNLNLIERATATATAQSKSLLTKKVLNSSSSETILVKGKTIKWEVTITVPKFDLYNLTLYDTLPGGLTLVEDSVEIDGNPIDDINVDLPPSETDGNTTFSFEIPQNIDGTYNATYKITYTTTVGEKYFAQSGQDGSNSFKNPSFSNKAWLIFSWGIGNGTPPVPAVELYGVDVDTHIIRKSGVYDRSAHTITWTVVINPYGVDIVEGTITDDLNKTANNLRLTYKENSFSASDDSFSLISDTDNELIVSVGKLGDKTASFTFETTVDDADHYAYNTPDGTDYYNTIDFKGLVKVEDNDVNVKDQVTARVKLDSEVVRKNSLDYNYNTNIITWQITVNQNKMHMDNVKLIDNIAEYQTFVSGSVIIDGKNVSDDSLLWKDASTFIIELGEINDQTVITFQTKVEVDKNPAFRNSALVEVENNVVLQRDVYENEKASAKQPINNQILSKNGKYDPENNKISYIVNVNPNGMNLTNILLKDTLPDGLRLDIDSVRLWKADINANGGFINLNEIVTNYNLNYNAADNSFSIELPEAKSYILTYECYIIYNNKTSYSNRIIFEGDYLSGDVKDDMVDIAVFGGGGLINSKTAGITITKQDSKRPDIKLGGITFQLWTKINGADKLVDEGVTDSDGKLSFYLLSLNRKYWLVEAAGISGYNADTAVVLSDGSEPSPLDGYMINLTEGGVTKEITINNDRNTANISFLKANDFGQPLKGAEFQLTDKDDNDVRIAVSGTDGIVIFQDVPSGEYELIETKTVTNHLLSTEIYNINVNPDGTYAIKDSNGNLIQKNADGTGIIINILEHSKPNPDADQGSDSGDVGTANIIQSISGNDLNLNPESPVPSVPVPKEPSNKAPETKEPDNEATETPGSETETSELPNPLPLPPASKGSILVPAEDEGYAEIDDEGWPFGIWRYDKERGEWVFEPYSLDKPNPKTGSKFQPPVLLLLSSLGLVLGVIGLIIKKHVFDRVKD